MVSPRCRANASRRRAPAPPTPTALRPPAQGWPRHEAYPGFDPETETNRIAVVGDLTRFPNRPVLPMFFSSPLCGSWFNPSPLFNHEVHQRHETKPRNPVPRRGPSPGGATEPLPVRPPTFDCLSRAGTCPAFFASSRLRVRSPPIRLLPHAKPRRPRRVAGVGLPNSPPLRARFIPRGPQQSTGLAHRRNRTSPAPLRGLEASRLFNFPPPAHRPEAQNTDSQRSSTRCGAPTDDSPQRELWASFAVAPSPGGAADPGSPTLSPEARFIPFRGRQQKHCARAEAQGRKDGRPPSFIVFFAPSRLRVRFPSIRLLPHAKPRRPRRLAGRGGSHSPPLSPKFIPFRERQLNL